MSLKNMPHDGTMLFRCDTPGCVNSARYENAYQWAHITMPRERRQRHRRERDFCPEHADIVLDLLRERGWLR